MRHALVAALLLMSCRRKDQLQPTAAELRVYPDTVAFGEVAMEARSAISVGLTNAGMAPLEVSPRVEGPFWVSETTVLLPGGSSQPIQVSFLPVREGAAAGVLILSVEQSELRVELSGVGVPACMARSCHSAAFDAETHRCVEANLPDDTTCSSPCLTDGRCRAGQCVGAVIACDDGNACTIDACHPDTGCVHMERTCPVSQCQFASCVLAIMRIRVNAERRAPVIELRDMRVSPERRPRVLAIAAGAEAPIFWRAWPSSPQPRAA